MRDIYCTGNCLSVAFESSFILLAGGQLFPQKPTLVIRKGYMISRKLSIHVPTRSFNKHYITPLYSARH